MCIRDRCGSEVTLTYEEWRNSDAGITNIRRKRTLEKEMFEKWEEKYAGWISPALFVFSLIIFMPLADKNLIAFIVVTGLFVGGTSVLLPFLIKKLYIGWKIKRM